MAGRGGCRLWLTVALGAALAAPDLAAQRPITLADAIAAAEARAPEVAVARADSAAAGAGVRVAREYPNPALALGYSRSAPRHHVEVEQPIDYPWLRSARVQAAERAAGASRLLLEAERATVRYEVEVAYARAAGAAALESLGRENVANGEELVRSVRLRREAGDVSELDVRLAELILAQLRTAALDDSLESVTARLALQSLMRLPVDSVAVTVVDSLTSPVWAALPGATPAPSSGALRVEAARAQLAAEEASILLARRGRIPAPALRAGFEQGDPDDPGLLPTFGISIPIPIFNRAGGAVAQARAAADRARAELSLVERETGLALATARRRREMATARLAVDRSMVEEARRVATLSRTAFREGAYPLATVLEARRNARDAMRRYVEDLIASRSAEAAYRLATTAGGRTP